MGEVRPKAAETQSTTDSKGQPAHKQIQDSGRTENQNALKIEKVEFKRIAKGQYVAVMTLEELLPKELAKATIRFLFLKAGSGLDPAKSATDIDATGGTQLRAAFPWCSAGGLLSKAEREVGFVLDLTPLKKWPSSAPKVIEAPLDSSTLLPGMDTRLAAETGRLYVAFVNYGKDGDRKVCISNTVSTIPHADTLPSTPSVSRNKPDLTTQAAIVRPPAAAKRRDWWVYVAVGGKIEVSKIGPPLQGKALVSVIMEVASDNPKLVSELTDKSWEAGEANSGKDSFSMVSMVVLEADSIGNKRVSGTRDLGGGVTARAVKLVWIGTGLPQVLQNGRFRLRGETDWIRLSDFLEARPDPVGCRVYRCLRCGTALDLVKSPTKCVSCNALFQQSASPAPAATAGKIGTLTYFLVRPRFPGGAGGLAVECAGRPPGV